MAPMTPATALEIPPELELADGVAPEDEEVEAALAQTPVELPHAAHQLAWSPMANSLILLEKVGHERRVSCCPNRG